MVYILQILDKRFKAAKKQEQMKVKNAGFANISYPETVEQAIKVGVGVSVNVKLGGKSNYNLGESIKASAVVKTIAGDKFINKGKMSRGLRNNLGRTVVLDINGIEVIVAERRFQPWDHEIFRSLGIELIEK